MNIRDSILVECYEDYVGLWSILHSIRFNNQQKLDTWQVRVETINLIENLLNDNLIQAGMFTDRGDFEIWQLSPSAIIAKIQTEWDVLGRDPTIADIVWFITTEKGDEEAKRLIEK